MVARWFVHGFILRLVFYRFREELMRYTLAVLAILIFLFCGCGGSSSRSSDGLLSHPQTTQVILESAVHPEGYIPLVEPQGLRLSLIGSGVHIDATGLRLIERFENVYMNTYCPYYDPYGRVFTRGFGETDSRGDFGGRCISHAQAEVNLKVLMESQYQWAVRDLFVPLTQHQVDALDSFVWNVGPGTVGRDTTVGSLLREGRYYQASVAMLAYDRAGGVVLPGLYTRRHVEFTVFNTRDVVVPLSVLYTRRRVITRYLKVYGCDRRVAHHLKTGPRCKRWRVELGNVNRMIGEHK